MGTWYTTHYAVHKSTKPLQVLVDEINDWRNEDVNLYLEDDRDCEGHVHSNLDNTVIVFRGNETSANYKRFEKEFSDVTGEKITAVYQECNSAVGGLAGDAPNVTLNRLQELGVSKHKYYTNQKQQSW